MSEAEQSSIVHQPSLSAQATIAPPDCAILHATLGRLRLRVPRIATDPDYASRLNWLVESFEFVSSVRLNPTARCLVVYYQPSCSTSVVEAQILATVEQAASEPLPPGAVLTKTEVRPMINWIERLGLPLFSLGLAFLTSELLLPIPGLIVAAGVIAAALPFVGRVVDTTVKQRQLDADILDVLWLSIYTMRGDFMAPSLMISMIETGEALRDTTARANERQAFDLLSGIDRIVRVERSGQEVKLPLKEVQRGDRVVVYAGEVIPVSGRVLRGTALIDEHKLTGESELVSRSEGQVVHASTQVLEGKICILTKRIGSNTRVGLTVNLLNSAPIYDTRVQDHSAQLANATIAPALLMSVVIFALTRDISRATALLHLDFGQGIRIAVPSTVLAALTFAARHGIYIRSGRALEMLAQIDTVVFDKTGTLTQGNAAVVGVKTAARRVSRAEVLRVAASAEQGNTHPVAGAILRAAEEQNLQISPCDAWNYRIGFGVVAQIDGQSVLVGSDRLLQQEGIDLNPLYERHPDVRSGSHSVVYVARQGKLLGAILYTDPARPESAQVIAALGQGGQQTYMLTGDSQRVASRVADQLKIKSDHTYAEAFPDRKVAVIQELRAQGCKVAFVGEGINDAAALAHADVSISFASGIDIAREAADVVLLDDDLRGIVHAIEIAKRAMEIVYQNTALIAFPNIGVAIAGVLFAFDPVLGVILSNGAALMAELNSFRPLFDPDSDPLVQILNSVPIQAPPSEETGETVTLSPA